MHAWAYFVLTPPFVFKYVTREKTKKSRQAVAALQENIQKIIQMRRDELRQREHLRLEVLDSDGERRKREERREKER